MPKVDRKFPGFITATIYYTLTVSGLRTSELLGQVLLKVFNEAPTTDILQPIMTYLEEQVRRT